MREQDLLRQLHSQQQEFSSRLAASSTSSEVLRRALLETEARCSKAEEQKLSLTEELQDVKAALSCAEALAGARGISAELLTKEQLKAGGLEVGNAGLHGHELIKAVHSSANEVTTGTQDEGVPANPEDGSLTPAGMMLAEDDTDIGQESSPSKQSIITPVRSASHPHELRAWMLALVDCITEACTVLLTPQTRPTDVFKKDDDLPHSCEASFLEAGLLVPQHSRHFPATKTPAAAGQDHQLRRNPVNESGSGFGVSTQSHQQTPVLTAHEASARSLWRVSSGASAEATHQHSHTDDEPIDAETHPARMTDSISQRREAGTDVKPGSTAFGWPAQANVNVITFAELSMGQLIGEGAFGKVYYGMWKDEEVAVKVLLADSADHNTQMAKEFEAEIRVMSALPPHPNVLKLVGACLAPPAVALVTQFCRKGSLYGILHSPEVQLSWSQIAHLCLGAARGMQHLHSLNCLHRDLKSGNLLVDASWTVKVADFGLARALESVAPLTGGLGTFQWMAPEVLARQHYSQKADVYAFGIVVWETCARQVPYAGLNGIQAALAVMERGLRPTIPPHTPQPLTQLIKACWAAIPEQRPSFNDITTELEILCHTLRGL
ncbi:hypothetical protein WJX73_010535 [Symbiochloris irregularis]|uniref:Protein kinase domain-containing protein n=1 Tax=Symbiochloris irregularis TaxID=706552 RepID=A0AAW1NR16_9CHLO